MRLGHGGKKRDKTVYASAPMPTIKPEDQLINVKAFKNPIFNQLHTPSCGGHAGTTLAMYKWQDAHNAQTFTPRFTWIMMKKDGPDTNPNDGSTMPQIFEAIQKYGVDDFEPLQNETNLTNAQYANANVVTKEMYANALTHKFKPGTYYQPSTIEELAALIDYHEELVILIQVGASMWTDKQGNDSWAESATQPLRPPQPVVDGHYVVAHSHILITDAQYRALQSGDLGMADIIVHYAPKTAAELGLVSNPSTVGKTLLDANEPRTRRIILCTNSWSEGYGFRGMLYFSDEYFPYVDEVGTQEAISASESVAPTDSTNVHDTSVVHITRSQKIPLFVRFINWLKKLFGIIPRVA